MSKQLMEDSLKVLSLVGLNPLEQNIWSRLRILIFLIMLVSILGQHTIEIARKWRGMESIKDIAFIIGIYQVVFRGYSLIGNKTNFLKSLKYLNQFWSTNESTVTKPKGLKNPIPFVLIRRTMIGVTIAYSFFVFLCLMTYFIWRTLPFKTIYAADKSPRYEITHFMQMSLTYICMVMYLGHDMLFISMIIHIVTDLKMIKRCMRQIDAKNGDDEVEKMIVLIEHHKFVLRCIKQIDNTFSVTLFNHFATSVICFCLISLTIVQEKLKLSALPINAMYLSAYFSQLLFYCGAGTIVTSEFESVSYAAYASRWWKKCNPKLSKQILLVMQRAQRTETLKAFGVFPLTLETFTNIINLTISYFSVMLALYNNQIIQ